MNLSTVIYSRDDYTQNLSNPKNEWVQPKEVAIQDGKFIHLQTKEEIIEGPSEKMSKSKKM